MKTHLIPLLLVLAATATAATDPAQFAAAKALYDARQFPEAEAAFKKLVAADAANAELHYYLGMTTGRRGDHEGASKILEKAVELAPKNAQYHYEFGNFSGAAAEKAGVLSKYGLAKKCLAGFQRAVELEPGNVDYHSALFEFYRQAPSLVGGGADKATAEAEAIQKLDPVRGHLAYVTFFTGEKKFDLALQHALEAKKLDPARGNGAVLNVYVETKQYDRALALFEEALKAAPDDYNTLYQLGRFSVITGQALDRGLAALRRCLELTPANSQQTHAAAQWRIGNILEKKNDKAGARAAYEASLKLDPKFTNAADALKKLK